MCKYPRRKRVFVCEGDTESESRAERAQTLSNPLYCILHSEAAREYDVVLCCVCVCVCVCAGQ